MKKILLAALLFAGLAACKNGGGNAEIENALKGFFDGMYARDFQQARANATQESEEVISLLESLAQDTDEQEKSEKPSIDIKEVVIEQDTTATAMVHASGQPNTVKMSLRKRAGKWLVAFDLRSLAIMMGQDPDAAEQEMVMPPAADDPLDTDSAVSQDLNLQREKKNRPPLIMSDTAT